MKILLLILILLSGCVSPVVNLDKSVKIIIDGKMCPMEQCGTFLPIWVNVEYTTQSELDTDFKADQDIKPQATIPF